jgi:L-seryl-tRNA(Ser) seleniumtransferase
VDGLAARLRNGSPAIFGRIQDDRLLLDLRTVHPKYDTAIVEAIVGAATGGDRNESSVDDSQVATQD